MKALFKKTFDRFSSRISSHQALSITIDYEIFKIFPRQELRKVIKIPCLVNNVDEDEHKEIIERAKQLRANMKINEQTICNRCPFQNRCRFSYQPPTGKEQNAFKDIYEQLELLTSVRASYDPRVYESGIKLLAFMPTTMDIVINDKELIDDFLIKGKVIQQLRTQLAQKQKKLKKVGQKQLETFVVQQTLSPLQHYKQQKLASINSRGKQNQIKPWGDDFYRKPLSQTAEIKQARYNQPQDRSRKYTQYVPSRSSMRQDYPQNRYRNDRNYSNDRNYNNKNNNHDYQNYRNSSHQYRDEQYINKRFQRKQQAAIRNSERDYPLK